MAVAHSAASESHTGTTGSTNQAAFSWTHTQTGTPQGVVVFVSTFLSTADLITSVTYGGVALTRLTGGLAQDAAGEAGRLDTFFLGSGLGTGNQTITVNRTNNATQMYASAATVTAGADTAVPTATIVLLEGDGTLAVQSVDDTSPGQNSVRYAGAYSGLNAPPTAGTGSTLLNSIDIGNYGAALVRETTAGQGARNVGFTGATDDRAAVHLAIRELVPRTETPIVGAFTLTGGAPDLTKASAPKVMDGGTGAFTLTGQPADLRHVSGIGAYVGKFFLPERNLFQQSEEFNSVWSPSNATVSINSTTAPDGTLTADTIVENTLSTPHTVIRFFTFTAGNAYTLSCYFKKYTGPSTRRARLRLANPSQAFGAVANEAFIDLDAGTIVSVSGGVTAAISDAGDGWYRVSITNTATVSTSTTITAGLATDASVTSYTGDGQSGVYVWGAQLEKSASVTAYDPTGAASATPASLSQQHRLDGGTGAFSLTGNDATLQRNYAVTAEVGTFSVTGEPVTLRHDARIEANTGSFALTGGEPALLHGRYLSGGAGEFIETGQPATFRRTWAIEANTGTFNLTGNPASLTEIGAYEIDPILGTFTLTGEPAQLTQSQNLPVDVGQFALTGNPVSFTQGYALVADAGQYQLTGNPATLAHGYAVTADTGAFVLTGNAATLAVGRGVLGQTGTFTFTGNPATLIEQATTQLSAELGAFALSGQQVTFSTNRALTGQTGVFNFTGNNATFTEAGDFQLPVDTGAFILTGLSATLAKTSTARRRNVLIF